MEERNILTVSQVTEQIKALLESDERMSCVYVRGEISNYKLHTSGHHYMTIKDDGAVINAVMFRSAAAGLKFKLCSGMKIIARGRISLFPKSGQYQIYISEIIPDGIGDLYVAFEQLREKLRLEGLFDRERKKAIPKIPKRIAILTSPTGAAVRDMLRIIGARFPMAEIIICPVLVQGAAAAEDIAGMINYVDRAKLADVMIVGRGGGSIEDLWAFNEEIVARAVVSCETPIISAVGHEPDVTIIDYVADLRAATPSNAAELVVPDRREIVNYLAQTYSHIKHIFEARILSAREKLEYLSERPILASPMAYIEERRMSLLYSADRIGACAQNIVHENKRVYVRAAALLDAMSPLKVLSRGYSIVTGDSDKIIRNASDLSADSEINVKFSKGTALCKVLTVNKK